MANGQDAGLVDQLLDRAAALVEQGLESVEVCEAAAGLLDRGQVPSALRILRLPYGAECVVCIRYSE